MITKIAVSLLAIALLGACQSTSTAKRPTLSETRSRIASNTPANSLNEPPPPAEGPEDVPNQGPSDLAHNPGLMPTPLLRANAIGNP
jgi:hypothetical protein